MPTVYSDRHGVTRSAWGSAIGQRFGRGPSGRVRNMRAMTDEKLLAVEDVLRNMAMYADPEALGRAQASLRERGYQLIGSGWTRHGQPVTRAQYVSAVAPDVRREDFDDEDEWLLAALAAG